MSKLNLAPAALIEPAIRTIGKGSIVRGAGGNGADVVVRGWLGGGEGVGVADGDCGDVVAGAGVVAVNVAGVLST